MDKLCRRFPEDKQNLEHFKGLKGKTYNVKLRIVGNSHTVSIPKEIVDFMEEMNKFNGVHNRVRKHFEEMDNMVRLCFEDMGKISLNFGQEMYDEEDESLNQANDDKRDEDDARRIALKRINLNNNFAPLKLPLTYTNKPLNNSLSFLLLSCLISINL